jgi:hypothetical protein
MKKLFLLFAILLSSLTIVSAQKMTSVYTSLSDKKCKTIESNPDEGGSYLGLCPGIGGYKLMLAEGDLRQNVTIVAPNKREYSLEFGSKVTSAFNAVGTTAEWRVTGAGKKVKPMALIVRLNAQDNPDNYKLNSSYLIVAKITANSACITNIVEPKVKNQNVVARGLADSAANKPCIADR